MVPIDTGGLNILRYELAFYKKLEHKFAFTQFTTDTFYYQESQTFFPNAFVFQIRAENILGLFVFHFLFLNF